MTTTHMVHPTKDAETKLRSVLMANTCLSVSTGLIGLVFGDQVADRFEIDQVWLVRLLAAGLLGFAAVVFAVALSSSPVLQRWSREISFADFGWVLGTVVVIALGWLSTSGIVVMAVIGLAVLALGLAQNHYRTNLPALPTA